jgi:CO/xanthine dehydrogenase Mo-binding subunit
VSAAEIRNSKLEELRVVHQPLPRHDQAEKIAGSTRYAGDLAFTNMLHARLVRAPLPSARITRRDGSAAAAVPGVSCVLFGEDVPHNVIWVDVPGQTVEVAALKASMEVLATDRVRFHGEPVALVVADSEEALAQACDLVEIDYEELPGVFDPTQALASACGPPAGQSAGRVEHRPGPGRRRVRRRRRHRRGHVPDPGRGSRLPGAGGRRRLAR